MINKIILTGANGFLGQTIIGTIGNEFQIDTLGRNNKSIIKVNLATDEPKISIPYDLVIHAAGKAHLVPHTIEEKQAFFDVNVTGTRNLLKGVANAPHLPKYFIFISSVAVYGLENGLYINETTPLLASDPYGLSKIEAENLILEWCMKNNIICTILRLPLLAAHNAPGNLGAMIRSIRKGFYFNINGGKTKKSIVLAKDVARILPIVAKIGGIYNLTDRNNPNFNELSAVIARQLKKAKPKSIPLSLAKLLARIGDIVGSKAPINSNKLSKITSDLTFDDSKAVKAFGWSPTKVLDGLALEQ